ncbi:NAD-dependent epimerase/dehydratase family protein [Candidatus Pacearchaeota archaeon]|nr:NAD-dependent epimerase/dehydratase family protein [Candidatus Pacearchaeota archaeon]
MRILVTGGAGFIGSNIVDRLIKNNDEVSIIDNLSSGYIDNVDKEAEFYNEDILDKEKIEDIFKKNRPEIVIHAAAQVQVIESMKNPQKDAMTNIIGSINILECCRDCKIKEIVYLSTGGALYGEPEYLPADENHPINPISCYGASKRAVENYIYVYNKNYNIDYRILRFSNVYGVRDDLKSNRLIPNILLNFKDSVKPKIYGDGNNGRDFIFVDDIVDAILLAIKNDNTKDKIFNIGTEKLISVNEIFANLKRIYGIDINPEYLEERRGEVKKIYLSNSRAKEQLDWHPKTDISAGLEKTVEWFKKSYC